MGISDSDMSSLRTDTRLLKPGSHTGPSPPLLGSFQPSGPCAAFVNTSPPVALASLASAPAATMTSAPPRTAAQNAVCKYESPPFRRKFPPPPPLPTPAGPTPQSATEARASQLEHVSCSTPR